MEHADYFKTAVSFAINGLTNVRLALVSVIPYVTILAAFGIFVLWNNGVVLGELQHHLTISFPLTTGCLRCFDSSRT